jgi:hypothetical protein
VLHHYQQQTVQSPLMHNTRLGTLVAMPADTAAAA